MDGLFIFVKTSINRTESSKNNLLTLCNEKKIKIIKIFDNPKGFKLSLPSTSEAEKLFIPQTFQVLSNCGFEPVLPDILTSQRTVFARKVDSSIFAHSTNDILSEINKKNGSIKVSQIIKFEKTSTLKIVTQNSQMADRICNEGLYLFFFHVPSHSINKDIYVKLINCYKCFAIDQHTTSACPNSSVKICSKCSKNHSYFDCNATPNEFKCINCQGIHHSLALKCPIRKNLIKEKRNRVIAEKTSYASKLITRSANTFPAQWTHPSTPRPPNRSPLPSLSQPPSPVTPVADTAEFEAQQRLKIFSITHLALLKDHECSGSFNEVYNKMAKDNDLPSLNLKSYVPPTKSYIGKGKNNYTSDVSSKNTVSAYPSSVQVEEDETPTSENSFYDASEGNSTSPVNGREAINSAENISETIERFRQASSKQTNPSASASPVLAKEVKTSRIISKDNIKLFKIKSTKTSTLQQIISAVINSKALITINEQTISDELIITKLFDDHKLKVFKSLAKNDFDNLTHPV